MIRKRCLNNKLFDEKLVVSEDAKMLNEILMEYPFLGVIHDTQYFYRKRQDSSSIIDISFYNMNYYTVFLTRNHQMIIDQMLQKYGHIPKYTQYQLIYVVQWHLKEDWNSLPKNIQRMEGFFFEMLKEILEYIDIEIILEIKDMPLPKKIYFVELKTGKKILPYYINKSLCFDYQNTIYILEKYRVQIREFKYKNGKLNIAIKYNSCSKYVVKLKLNGVFYDFENYHNYFKKRVMNSVVIEEDYAKITIDLKTLAKKGNISVYLVSEDNKIKIKIQSHSDYSQFRNINDYRFFHDNYMFTYKKKDSSIAFKKN